MIRVHTTNSITSLSYAGICRAYPSLGSCSVGIREDAPLVDVETTCTHTGIRMAVDL